MITVYQGNLSSQIQEEIEKDSSSFLGSEKKNPMAHEKYSVNALGKTYGALYWGYGPSSMIDASKYLATENALKELTKLLKEDLPVIAKALKDK